MLMKADPLYQALCSRDARFDGRFFTGVKTTGVYCRPVCPAPTPKRQNVEFFSCAAAAEAAGFRACRRCRPEAAPGAPAWMGTTATVSRALRLIDEGALDVENVERLAARLGVTGRHLRRLFDQHVGASPVAVAQTRRTHFARRLIDQTTLPMTEVAFAAGFASVRRFNSSIRQAFGRAPLQLRDAVRTSSGAGADDALILRLSYRPPFDWGALLAFLQPRVTPGVEAVVDGVYRRTIRLDSASTGVIEVVDAPQRRAVELRARGVAPGRLLEVIRRVRRMFDLDADPLHLASALRADAMLAPLIERRPGLRVPGAWDPFELAVRAVLGQQVSVAAATRLAGKLAATFGSPLPEPAAHAPLDRVFPTAEQLAAAPLDQAGLPAARGTAIRELAKAVCSGQIVFDSAAPDRVRGQLLAVPGIGPWTVDYIAIRALGEPDAFPAGDLALRRALSGEERLWPRARVEAASNCWRPWRTYAAMHLWTDYAARAAAKPQESVSCS